ncbi:MAG TPA: carboxypeptidase-like regulatory domain-containing protein [Verrucomicrobiae bacterium]|nr:carboxypeptidase-like regulatory domain-containing protein [Verrucomicrobiae bacterium]
MNFFDTRPGARPTAQAMQSEMIHSSSQPSRDRSTFRPSGRTQYFVKRLFFSQILLYSALLLAPLCLLCVQPAKAGSAFQDDKKEAELRTIHGIVIDKNENGVPSSIVFLENMKTQGVRTYFADSGGNYRFSGLDPNEDYEIHAEKGDLISSTRTISSFDSRRDIEMVLKLIHKKK